MIVKRFFILAALLALSACSGNKTEVEYLGPLQGENSGQPGFAYQGMDICGDYMVSCQNQGIATVYRLSGDAFEPQGQFHLASFHEFNHANVASFGVEKFSPEDPLPVLYVSQCHKKSIDGKKDVLYVERIAPDFSGSSLVQTIFYDDVNKDFGYALQWVIDLENKMLYGYGNTISNSDPFNRHRIIKFRLPALSDGLFVVLRSEDALENYLIEDVSGFRFNPIGQGLYIRKNLLYMPTGVGKAETPSILYIWDLKKRRMRAVDLSLCTTGEFEDISYYKGAFYIQGQDGIFKVRLGRNAGKADYDWHAMLPVPVYDARPEYLELYHKAWELAYEHIDTLPGIPSPVYIGHFCKYCPSVFPGVSCLDRFYQIPPSDIPPIPAWTEYRYALQTGSRGRLRKCLPALRRWFENFDSFDPSVKSGDALRKKIQCRVETLSQLGLSALSMSKIAGILGKEEERQHWAEVHSCLSSTLNDLCRDAGDSFSDGGKCKVPAITSFLPVLAEMTGEEHAAAMMAHLKDSLSLGEFVPTTYMALKAADLLGEYQLAREVGGRIMEQMYRTFKENDQLIGECCSPAPIGPISIFIEDLIGIKEADGFGRTLLCDFEKHPAGKVGVRNYRFGDVVCDVIADETAIEVEANRPFTLYADGKSFSVEAGKNSFARP